MAGRLAKKRTIYLDHAAGTPVRIEVMAAMKPYFSARYGNPSALYGEGVVAHEALETARATIARIIHAQPENLIFTGGGTESCNLAVLGTARRHSAQGKHIITTAIEHHAVLNSCQALEREGFEVTYLTPDSEGRISVEEVRAALRPNTILVSVMMANNEIGTIEPVAEIGKMLVRERKENATAYPYFHTDACQAAGYLPLDVEKLHVDLMTVNAGKMYGPKGVGLLYVRAGIELEPLMYGGGQEMHRRSGTENVPGIVGFARAFELADREAARETKRVTTLASFFVKELQKRFSVTVNGPAVGSERLPNNINVSFPHIEAETLLLYLDRYGIMAATGSACTARAVDTSHVLRAIGLSPDAAKGSVRFTLGRESKRNDVNYVIAVLKKVLLLLKP